MKRFNYGIKIEVHKDFENYLIFSDGTIFSRSRYHIQKNGRKRFKKGRWLKVNKYHKYPRISMNSKTSYVHRIIAETFLGKPQKNLEINHIDGDKTNNRVENLEWITHQENMEHARKKRLYAQGERHYKSKMSDATIREIVELYKSTDLTQQEVADKFNINQSLVSNYVQGKKRRTM